MGLEPHARLGPLVVGLDISLTATGIATSRGAVRTIKSTGQADATLADRHRRMHNLRVDICLAAAGATLVVVEGAAFSSTTGHMHDRSGLWWLVVDWLLRVPEDRRGCRVVAVSPTSLKTYATGKGNAGKDAVLAAVVRRYPWAWVENNNESDAWTLACMGARWLGHPVETSLPQTHLRAMDGVAWPVAP